MSDKKIIATFIIEILGKPIEHVKESLEQLTEKLGEEKGVRIIEKKFFEPRELEVKDKEGKKIEKQEKLFTAFVDIEAEFDAVENLLMSSFAYLPSNIEIIHPENLVITNSALSEMVTGVIMKLHKYDEVAKNSMMNNQILAEKLKELMDKEKGNSGGSTERKSEESNKPE